MNVRRFSPQYWSLRRLSLKNLILEEINLYQMKTSIWLRHTRQKKS